MLCSNRGLAATRSAVPRSPALISEEDAIDILLDFYEELRRALLRSERAPKSASCRDLEGHARARAPGLADHHGITGNALDEGPRKRHGSTICAAGMVQARLAGK